MSYSNDHAGALRDVQKAGRAVTFTRIVQNIDALTETNLPPTVTTVGGFAIQVKGNPRQYESLKLTDKQPLTLVFVASNYGDDVELDSVVVFVGLSYVVRSTDPVAPDGNTILTRIVLST